MHQPRGEAVQEIRHPTEDEQDQSLPVTMICEEDEKKWNGEYANEGEKVRQVEHRDLMTESGPGPRGPAATCASGRLISG